jgi:hypothetical protein
MKKVLNSIDDAATKQEYDDLKKKFIEFETKMSEEKKGEKLINEKELAELKKTITELESQMVQEKKEKLEMEIEHVDLKKKFTVLETLVSEQKEVKQISFCLLAKRCMSNMYLHLCIKEDKDNMLIVKKKT